MEAPSSTPYCPSTCYTGPSGVHRMKKSDITAHHEPARIIWGKPRSQHCYIHTARNGMPASSNSWVSMIPYPRPQYQCYIHSTLAGVYGPKWPCIYPPDVGVSEHSRA